VNDARYPQVRDAGWVRDECARLVAADDWYALYRTAMAWRTVAGGSWTPEAWLMDVASALLHRQPKTAVHCCDLALTTWVERPLDRLVLRGVRGVLVRGAVGDPLRAIDDLEAATAGPGWIADVARAVLALAQEEGARSRVRRPRVGPSPAFTGEHRSPVAAAPDPLPADGAEPVTWAVLRPLLGIG
jgi:hypothetical protein